MFIDGNEILKGVTLYFFREIITFTEILKLRCGN